MIAPLGNGELDPKGGIPLGVVWGHQVRAENRHSYAVRCTRSGVSDFYAAFTVKKVDDDGIEIEWTLLTGGLGAPESIHEARRADDNDGADGKPGLCGRNAR